MLVVSLNALFERREEDDRVAPDKEHISLSRSCFPLWLPFNLPITPSFLSFLIRSLKNSPGFLNFAQDYIYVLIVSLYYHKRGNSDLTRSSGFSNNDSLIIFKHLKVYH